MAFFGEPPFSGTKASQLCGILWSPHREHLRTKATAHSRKVSFLFWGPFLIARKRFEEMRMSSVLFFAFVCVILSDFEIIDQSGGKSSTMRPNATGHFNPKFHVNLSFFRQKFKVAIHSGVIKLSFFFCWENAWINFAGISRR